MSIFALGIMPYITSSIIIQLLTVVVPKLDELKKEGEQGRRRSTSTRATARSSSRRAVVVHRPRLRREPVERGGAAVVDRPGPGLPSTDRADADRGHVFVMWLGEQITERGIGNGISLIIFAGIVAAHARRADRAS